jgi:hypothetical protein
MPFIVTLTAVENCRGSGLALNGRDSFRQQRLVPFDLD